MTADHDGGRPDLDRPVSRRSRRILTIQESRCGEADDGAYDQGDDRRRDDPQRGPLPDRHGCGRQAVIQVARGEQWQLSPRSRSFRRRPD
jgi:hypothetical protein